MALKKVNFKEDGRVMVKTVECGASSVMTGKLDCNEQKFNIIVSD